jgi:hypothetical protein
MAAQARISRLRLGRHRRRQRRPRSRDSSRRRKTAQPRRDDSPQSARRHLRHRPHALGHARPSHRRERAPASRLHRPRRRRSQRHHRKLSATQRTTAQIDHQFVTETDTEIIAHLIEEYLKQDHNFREGRALGRAELRGIFALSIINADEPDTIIAVARARPSSSVSATRVFCRLRHSADPATHARRLLSRRRRDRHHQ